jgi:hypothetical protein
MGFTRKPMGFHIDYVNGVEVSVAFAYNTYCSNYDNREADPFYNEKAAKCLSCGNAEIAVIYNRKLITAYCPACERCHDVVGYQTPDQALAIMVWAAGLTIEDLTTIQEKEAARVATKEEDI